MEILFDLHTHTISSGHAYSTLKEYIEQAKARGLIAYGFSDHSQATPGILDPAYFINFKVIPDIIDGVRVYGGVEANILDAQGKLDCNEKLCSSVDYVIASLHTLYIKPGDASFNTDAIIAAMDNPYVKIIGHPDDGRYPLEYDRLVKAALLKGVLLEANNSSLNSKNSRRNTHENMTELLLKCKEYGAKVIMGTDSHICYDVGIFDRVLELMNSIDFPKELVVNYSLEELEKIMKKPE